jgi:hypothetical protein
MEEKTREELFALLHNLEDYFGYDETKRGREIGAIIDRLHDELLKKEEI